MQLGTRFRALALVSVGLFVAAACGGGGGGGNTSTILSSYKPVPGVQGGQLVYSDWESVQDLNPVSSSAATTDQATGLIFAGLWQFDPQNNAIPDLVSEVPTVANGDVKIIDATHMDITIKLKSGLKWWQSARSDTNPSPPSTTRATRSRSGTLVRTPPESAVA